MKTKAKVILSLIAGIAATGIAIGVGNSYKNSDGVGWQSWDIDAEVYSNGDMKVHEVRKLNSDYGSEFTINLNSQKQDGFTLPSALKDNEVTVAMYTKDDAGNKKFYAADDYVTLSGSGVVGTKSSGTYISFNNRNGVMDFYTNISSGTPNNLYIDVSYTVQNALVKYDDYTSLNWKFAYASEGTDAKNVKLNITIPENNYEVDTSNFNENGITFLGAGMNYGSYKDISYTNTNYSLSSSALYEDDDNQDNMEVLLVVPNTTDIFNEVSDNAKPGKNGKDFLSDNISSVVSQRNKYAKKVNTYKKIGIIGGALLSILALGAIIYIYINYDKELKPNFKENYYRELPATYGPGAMAYLMSEGEVNQNALNAETIDLIRKGYIIINTNDEENIKNPNYIMTRNNAMDVNDLPSSESYLMKWYFDEMASGKDTLSFKEIEAYMKKASTAQKYVSSNDEWKRVLEKEVSQYGFFDDMSDLTKLKPISWLCIALGVVLLVVGALQKQPFIYFLFPGIAFTLIVFFVMYIQNIKRKSERAIEDYAKWKGFKNFLNDYAKFSEADINDVNKLKEYMVYAVAFGIADNVDSQLKLKFTKEGKINAYERSGFFGGYGYCHICCYQFNHYRTVGRQTITAANAKSSSHSSHGGSFGGGGGGGHSSFH